MIPRFRPYIGVEELRAAFIPNQGAVECFEKEFASIFDAKYGLAFPYGRSALWAFFKALEIQDADIILPAYTCVVVANAIVLSGNRPKFVDISLNDYNMNLNQVAEAINENTKAIIATHLFGYPLDIDCLTEIVHEAEKRIGHKIWVIQDCAHSFGAKWKGKLVTTAGDAALYGLNISKIITSIFGGMITTNDKALYDKLKSYRDAHFKRPGLLKAILRFIYIASVYLAFKERIYSVVYWLQENSRLLDGFTKAYHLDEKIHFPPDYLDRMLPIEASVGLIQIKKYYQIIINRKKVAEYYDKNLPNGEGWIKPPLLDGATYSHYVLLVQDREKILREMARRGVQLGRLVEYSVPHMSAYQEYANRKKFPISRHCSRNIINLPVHSFLTSSQIEEIGLAVKAASNGK